MDNRMIQAIIGIARTFAGFKQGEAATQESRRERERLALEDWRKRQAKAAETAEGTRRWEAEFGQKQATLESSALQSALDRAAKAQETRQKPIQDQYQYLMNLRGAASPGTFALPSQQQFAALEAPQRAAVVGMMSQAQLYPPGTKVEGPGVTFETPTAADVASTDYRVAQTALSEARRVTEGYKAISTDLDAQLKAGTLPAEIQLVATELQQAVVDLGLAQGKLDAQPTDIAIRQELTRATTRVRDATEKWLGWQRTVGGPSLVASREAAAATARDRVALGYSQLAETIRANEARETLTGELRDIQRSEQNLRASASPDDKIWAKAMSSIGNSLQRSMVELQPAWGADWVTRVDLPSVVAAGIVAAGMVADDAHVDYAMQMLQGRFSTPSATTPGATAPSAQPAGGAAPLPRREAPGW